MEIPIYDNVIAFHLSKREVAMPVIEGLEHEFRARECRKEDL